MHHAAKLEMQPSAITMTRTVTVSARAYAERGVEQGFDFRHGYFKEVDTVRRNTGLSAEVLHDAAMVG